MNENRLWFKHKKYGWGWTPSNWKGWLVIILYPLGLSICPLMAEYGFVEYEKTMILFWGFIVLWTFCFFLVLIKKGGIPSWRWGK